MTLFRAADRLDGSRPGPRPPAAGPPHRRTRVTPSAAATGSPRAAPARCTCACTGSPTTSDAPRGRAWVRQHAARRREGLAHRGRLPRLPRARWATARRGGDARFDVYLQDVGTLGAYGYCTPERRRPRPPGRRPTAGYCVLDKDFSARPVRRRAAGPQPEGDRGPRVLPRRAVGLRRQRGPVVHGVDRGLDGGAGRRRAQRQPPVPALRPARAPRPPARPVPAPRLRPVRRLRVLGAAHPSASATASCARPGPAPRARARARHRLRAVLAPRRGLPAVLAEYGAALTDPVATFDGAAGWPAGRAPTPVAITAAHPRAQVRARLDHLATTSWVVRRDPALPAGTRLVVRVRGPQDPRDRPRRPRADRAARGAHGQPRGRARPARAGREGADVRARQRSGHDDGGQRLHPLPLRPGPPPGPATASPATTGSGSCSASLRSCAEP